MDAVEPSSRARLLFAAGLASALVVGVVAVALSGGEESTPAAAADPRCLEQWNGDPAALTTGRHQYTFHRYTNVQILRLDTESAGFEESPDGDCAIVFASSSLDSEAAAAALIQQDREWTALSAADGVTTERLGELQSEAVAGANAIIDVQGRIAPL